MRMSQPAIYEKEGLLIKEQKTEACFNVLHVSTNNKKEKTIMNISVKAFENADPDSAVKAHVNMTIDNAFVVKNLAVVEGRNGLFVNMPHHKSSEVGEDGKPVYKDDAFPLNKDLRDQIRKAAVESYEKGGAEISFEYETAQKAKTKTNPEKSGKEDARQGKPSVLKNLSEEKKASRASKPVTVSAAEKKAVGAER